MCSSDLTLYKKDGVCLSGHLTLLDVNKTRRKVPDKKKREKEGAIRQSYNFLEEAA